MSTEDVGAASQGGAEEHKVMAVREMLAGEVEPHVNFTGIARTHASVLAKDIAAIRRCKTADAIAIALAEAKQRWLSLGIFRDAKYSLTPLGSDLSSATSSAQPVNVDITVNEARPRKSIGVYTTDTSMPEVTMSLENVLGGRYSVKGNYIPPASRVHAVSLSLLSAVPLIGRDAEYYIGRRSESKTCHVASGERIEEVKAVTRSGGRGVTSEWSIGVQRRTLACTDANDVPCDLLCDFAGPLNKNFVRHELAMTRVAYHAHPVLYNMYPLPIYGSEVYASNEFAGGVLGGDFSFVKSELQHTRYWPLGNFFSLQCSLRVAGIVPLFATRIPLNDRLFLSNCHVRGYKSVGPCTRYERGSGMADAPGVIRIAATGGNALWAVSGSLNFPFPLLPSNGVVAMHVFANAGGLRLVNSLAALVDMGRWLRECACSVGAGIVITRIPLLGIAPSGRFELNFAIPLDRAAGGGRQGGNSFFDHVRFGLVWSSTYTF